MRVKALFLEAVDLPVDQVPAFLVRACGDDTALHAEVASLLAHHDDRALIASSTPPVRRKDPLGLVGEVLEERYRVDRWVADGGFGHVYRGFHLFWDLPVAIKVFKPPHAEQSAALRRAFIREGAILNRLSRQTHSIIQSYDVGRWTTRRGADVLYTVLEWLDGVPLSQAPAPEGGWTPASVHARLAPVAEALARCHAEGVAHRDVKPGNLFVLSSDGPTTMKVLDFGIAKEARANGRFITSGPGASSFTVDYAAPEQLDGGRTGPWTDVYALAMVCVELLLGRHPFRQASLLEALFAIRDPQRRPTPRAVGVKVPDEVEAAFGRALAVESGARFPDAGAFWEALGRAS